MARKINGETRVEKDYISSFREAVREAGVVYNDSDYVKGFMWFEGLSGKNIYNELMKELEKLKDEGNQG